MRILVVTQYFWPENFRINDLCEELVRRGHDLTILTGKPNYPGGKIYDDYKNNPPLFSQYQGCNIIRVPMIARGQGNSIQLIFNYLSFALSASVIGLFKLRKIQFDVIFVFEPSPITVGLPAVFLKKFKRIPIVFWVLDLWPETLEAVGVVKSKKKLAVVGKLVSFIYNRCDLILGQSMAFIDGISQYCEDKAKVRYFPSWSEDLFSQDVAERIDEVSVYKDDFRVLFAGNVGDAQDFPSIMKAMGLLKHRKIKAKLFIVGHGRKLSWLEEYIEEKELEDYVFLLGHHPLEKMPRFYASADALLVTLNENKIFSMTIPGKVQSYMAAGKPILAMLNGEGSRVIEEANCGYTSRAGDYNNLAESIITMSTLKQEQLNQLGLNAILYSHYKFDRKQLISQLESWFLECVKQNETRG
jgi:colanic acid biosynthesis glycosyl transferase WcaI